MDHDGGLVRGAELVMEEELRRGAGLEWYYAAADVRRVCEAAEELASEARALLSLLQERPPGRTARDVEARAAGALQSSTRSS